MEQIFNFDCFALLADEWTLPSRNEPSEPEDSPAIYGFYLSAQAAADAAARLEAEREAAYRAECARWHYLNPSRPQRSYFIVPVNNLKLRKGDGLCQIDDYLIAAARLMAQGVGGAELALPAYTETPNI
jgi:hypothetical protein